MIYRTNELVVLTWFWTQPDGRTDYTPFHVNVWGDMVRRHLKMPHRIACVTDTPEGIDPRIEIITPPGEFEQFRIPSWQGGRPQCLRRLSMFRWDAVSIFGERFVCMDLDCTISGPLDSFFETDAEFKICSGTAPNRPYNGSMMLLKAASRTQVYDKFSLQGAIEAGNKFVGSDQAWISHILGPNEQTWGRDDGLAWFGRRHDSKKLMFFPGWEKPWMVAQTGYDPWITDNYRRESQGKCLILGYDETLWQDVSEALKMGGYDAVIASPEAAEHWPGDILAVARTNDEAGRIAYMHGLEPTWCGVSEVNGIREAA